MADARLTGVRKSFGATEVIRGVDLSIEDGEFVVFVGPSGCGKSTLLRMIAGLETVTAGDIHIGGVRCNDMPPKARRIAMVFQSYALYPHKSVFGNMAFGLRMAGLSRDEIRRRVDEAATTLEIGNLLQRRPSQLSGGQRQRVAIGRAIVREPSLFLFDEPLSNLDAALRVNMRMEIARLHRALKATMIYVTHDQVEAMTLADQIVVLDKGVARQIGAPLDIYHNPADLFVAGFIGSPRMTILPAEVAAGDGDRAQLIGEAFTPMRLPESFDTGATPGSKLSLGVRPEDIAIAAPDDAADANGVVETVERLGPQTQLGVRLKDGSLAVAMAGAFEPARAGDAVGLSFARSRIHLFAADGKALARGMPGRS